MRFLLWPHSFLYFRFANLSSPHSNSPALSVIITRSSHFFIYHFPSENFPIIPQVTHLPPLNHSLLCNPMEDILANMWNSLSLDENESITLTIDELKLPTPKYALIGKLAMKKFASTFVIDKTLKSMWGTINTMETTLIGENLFLFSFSEVGACERILEKQPWNYRGSIILLEKPHENGSPTDFTQHKVPFWAQVHGFSVRAMNKAVGEEVGALLGNVLEVHCDMKG